MPGHLAALMHVSQFSWLDVVDILIVAFIVYQLLQFIRGTHAVQMALGGLVLVILYWASQLFNLETVNWLLRTFLPYVVFGIIVVFQTEIRKVLAHLGKTPLHDGAVVIQGNRVAAAACFLPLTVNPALSRELGSRHRAAIGVTEDTDALAVVVSEETGGISVVVGGNIRRNVDGRALKQALLEGLEVQEAASEPEGAPHTLPARDK